MVLSHQTGVRIPVALPGLLSILFLAPASPPPKPVEVKTTQGALIPRCLDGAPVAAGTRSWKLDPREHSLAFSMKNDPRPGAPAGEEPGVAQVRFTLEPGHRYEVEVRAPSISFSQRSWNKGEWRPVVRDRTLDRVVSGDPEWIRPDCRSSDAVSR